MASQRHRGPDDEGVYLDPECVAGLAHNRLSIIDLSPAGHQPMSNYDGQVWIAFNGEIYNYEELRAELSGYPFRSRSDTEVILAAYERWGEGCLDRFIGMFAFLIWDGRRRRLFAARDRFGVKPLYYSQQADGTIWAASEMKALWQAGIAQAADECAWATYLATGYSDHSPRTFWKGICALRAGHYLTWQDGRVELVCWYDPARASGPEYDDRPADVVEEEYLSLARECVRLRFRSDVPVAINLSGGLDSSILLGIVDQTGGGASDVKAYTFVTGDPAYDELPWARRMLAQTRHESVACQLDADTVPELAETMMRYQEAPYGGIPTLAYSRLFQRAKSEGVTVLLDGQGMDEQWAGYDYYAQAGDGATRMVQGTTGSSTLADCLTPGFRALAEPFDPPRPYGDSLRNLQYRDIRYTKLPRALRFNDRASMCFSTELREPFLDHRLVELGLRQPKEHKIVDGIHKWLLRRIAARVAPGAGHQAGKRPVQTPQREWLRGPLRGWAGASIERALAAYGGCWLDVHAVRNAWSKFLNGESDNSFYIWQWISLAMMDSATRESGECAKSRCA